MHCISSLHSLSSAGSGEGLFAILCYGEKNPQVHMVAGRQQSTEQAVTIGSYLLHLLRGLQMLEHGC